MEKGHEEKAGIPAINEAVSLEMIKDDDDILVHSTR
jgi:hypothetical protein